MTEPAARALGLYFAHPWVLLIAFPAVLLALALRGKGWWLRLPVLLLLVAALAQPWWATPGGRLAVLVDVSDSVGAGALDRAREFDFSGLARPTLVGYVAAETTLVNGLGERVPSGTATDATDIARALQVAVANGASRVLLISDGVTPPDPLWAGLPAVPVDVAPVRPIPDVRVVELLLPAHVAPGQRSAGTAVVRADRATPATFTLRSGGSVLEERPVELPAGESALTFAFSAPADGAAGVPLAISASLSVPFDQPTGNDSASSLVAVHSRPSVLVLNDPEAARLLRLQGLDVVEGPPEALAFPISYSAVVVRGSAREFTMTQLDLLAQYVRDGGGLLMTGGPESFGFGAWYRTSVEDVLPVTTDLRTEVSLPLVAMVMVIDRSQSMTSGRPARIDLAKEGAIQVVDLAYEQDLLGLVAFSDGPGTRWVFPLRQATERGKREMAAAITALDTGGGTVLEPAYRMALEALMDVDAAVKHVIILSDGQLYDRSPFGGDGTDFGAMAGEALAAGITTSAIAIGDAADFERLAAIAVAGGGRYYAAKDAGSLPRIFTNEALTATRALLIDVPTVPQGRPNPLYAFPSRLPAVRAYVATSLKAGAQLLLAGADGEPILATYRVGLGRTAVLTTDLNAWAGALGSWPELPGLMGTLLRWLQLREGGMTASALRQGNEVLVTLDAVRDGYYLNDLRPTARFGTSSTTLEQVAPGRYQGRLPWRGTAGPDVVVSLGNELVSRARVGGSDPEYAVMDGAALLASLAERTGGSVVDPETYAPDVGVARRPVWQVPLLAALAAFMLELVWRRWGRAKAGPEDPPTPLGPSLPGSPL